MKECMRRWNKAKLKYNYGRGSTRRTIPAILKAIQYWRDVLAGCHGLLASLARKKIWR